MEDESDDKPQADTNKIPNAQQNKPETEESEESLSLSLTLPFPEENNKKSNNSDESISEHLTSNSASIENDRSYQEIEITNRPSSIFFNLPSDDEKIHISQENVPRSLEASFCSDNSVISLSYLDKANMANMEVDSNVRSILEEILGNDQFRSNSQSLTLTENPESLNIFENVDLDDHSLINFRANEFGLNEKNLFASNFNLLEQDSRRGSEIDKRIKDFEEIIAIKDGTIAALTSELDSFREFSATNTVSMVSTTEYKQLQEECHAKLMEYNSAIIYKNDLIQQLTESLDQSVAERGELLAQVDQFKGQIAQLQVQLQETTKMVTEHECINQNQHGLELKTDEILLGSLETVKSDEKHDLSFNFDYSKIEEVLDGDQRTLLNDLKIEVNDYLKKISLREKSSYKDQISKLKDKIATDKEEYQTELTRLRDLLGNIKCGSMEIMELKTELEAKHSREVEELRTYFEKKCADLEKNYSEEIFSQQSRKMSGSSCSEAELNSDALFSHPPGPDGDAPSELLLNFTKKDLANVRNELKVILNKIEKFNIEDMDEEEFTVLKSEIGKCNLNSLLKYDLALVKKDLRTTFSIDLDILRGENNNKIESIKEEYQKKIKDLESKYQEEIEDLKEKLEEKIRENGMVISSTVQQVASPEEFEIDEVIMSYERRLQEQVTVAKMDIIRALEFQIQRLASNQVDDEEWPAELLQLRDKFTDKYKSEIQQLKEDHEKEVVKLKEEHLKILNGALERARRRSLKDGDGLNKAETEVVRDRDNLKKQVASLRNLLGELLKYFVQCENELNNTLVDELLRQGFDKNLSQLDEDLNLNDSSTSSSGRAGENVAAVTRVHLTPNFNELINYIENDSREYIGEDISIDLKNGLGACLEKLKQEANAILALTSQGNRKLTISPIQGSSTDEEKTSLTKQLVEEKKIKESLKGELNDALKYVDTLEKEKNRLEIQLEDVIARENVLEKDLIVTRTKLSEMIENGRKEIVSEGYGEEGVPEMQALGDAMATLAELQEKTRNLMVQSRASADPSLLRLIEELCAVSEKIKEESQKEKLDLLQQVKKSVACSSGGVNVKIDAADKKYRVTQKFLEDQANEREQERDEAQKKIDWVYEQLKDRERDRMNCERMIGEVVNGFVNKDNDRFKQVEHLENQLQEMTKLHSAESEKRKYIEAELNEAVEKIKELRDIIRELEFQKDSKSEALEKYILAVGGLEDLLVEQDKVINELKHNNSLKDSSEVQLLKNRLESLEAELQQTRVNAELAGNDGVFRKIKSQLFDFESYFDVKTKELEVLHTSETNSCSSPSEDISARDLVNQKMDDECEVPLQQLARLKEKLVRHSRAEDAAIKRIKDLEMRLSNMKSLKSELEEANNEKEYLEKQIQEHLVLISDLQIRLDEQRIRADHVEKQTNTSLELKIFDLQTEVSNLRDVLQNKDKTIANLQNLLEETRTRLKTVESEMNSAKDDDLLVSMQKELEALRDENKRIKLKMTDEARIVPNLVENIISDKNTDIEKLTDKLNSTEKMLESYLGLNLEKRELQMLADLKNSGTSLTEVIGILDLSRAEQMRRLDSRSGLDLFSVSKDMPFKRNANETTFLGCSGPEISSIERVGPRNVLYSVVAPLSKPNSTEIHPNKSCSGEKRVHFKDFDLKISEVESLSQKLAEKDTVLKEYEERLKTLAGLEKNIENLHLELNKTEKTLLETTEALENQRKESGDSLKDIGVELAEVKMHLSEKEKKIAFLEQDVLRWEEMCTNLTRQKQELEKHLREIKDEDMQSLKVELEEKNAQSLSLLSDIESLQNVITKLQDNNNLLGTNYNKTKEENVKLEKDIKNNKSLILQLTKDLNDVEGELNNLKAELYEKVKNVKDLETQIEHKEKSFESLQSELQKQKNLVADKDCEIEIANEDARTYLNEVAKLEEQVKNSLEDSSKINELYKENNHLKDLVKEKEKCINDFTVDRNKLSINLASIQNVLKETGIVEKRLKEEQKKTANLMKEIYSLKAELLAARQNVEMTVSVDEITNQLKKELDYSAEIDSNIINAVSDQSLSSICETQDLENYKKSLNKERVVRKKLQQVRDELNAKISNLERNLMVLQTKNEELQELNEKQRLSLRQTQLEDGKVMEQLRLQLDSAIDSLETLENQLFEEKMARRKLENELEQLKSNSLGSAGSKTESTKYKDLPSKELIELNKLKSDYEALKDIKQQLIHELKSLNQAKSEVENSFKYTKDLLDLETEKAKNLEKKLEKLTKNEKEIKENLRRLKNHLEEKVQEVENNKIAMDELQHEKIHLNKQKQELLERLRSQPIVEPSNVQNQTNDVLFDKIKELNAALLDNKKLIDVNRKLLDEKSHLKNQISRMEIFDNLSVNDLIERSDYLFAKTLKLESTKKALIWQKRYLMGYLEAHRRYCLIEALPDNIPERYTKEFKRRRSPKQTFKAVVLVIMSIHRMQFLVKRWHSRTRFAHKLNSRHYRRIVTDSERTAMAEFRVGQPVSSQLFSNATAVLGAGASNLFRSFETNNVGEACARTAPSEDNNFENGLAAMRMGKAWSGTTPPSKEAASSRRIRIGANFFSKEDMTPLKAPQLLAQFVERFDQIQEKLELGLDTNGT